MWPRATFILVRIDRFSIPHVAIPSRIWATKGGGLSPDLKVALLGRPIPHQSTDPYVGLTLRVDGRYRVGYASEEIMIQTDDESLEMIRQRLIAQSLSTSQSLSEAMAVFEIARELVPLPVLVNYEPTRYSTSTSGR